MPTHSRATLPDAVAVVGRVPQLDRPLRRGAALPTSTSREPIHEESDSAANSLLVLKAKQLELLHGHYSRFGFYHPGPALIYVEAAGEWVAYDLLGAVPAPHNGHIFGLLLMHSALVGIAITCVVGATGRLDWARPSASHFWCTSRASAPRQSLVRQRLHARVPAVLDIRRVGRERADESPRLAALTVRWRFTVTSASLRSWCRSASTRCSARGARRVPPPHAPARRRSWGVFAAVVGLFVLPIVLHTALHYPGEVGRDPEPHAPAHSLRKRSVT